MSMVYDQCCQDRVSVHRLVVPDDRVKYILGNYTNSFARSILLIMAEYLFPGITRFDIWKKRDCYPQRVLPEYFKHILFTEIKELLLVTDTQVEILNIDYHNGLIILNVVIESN